MTEALDDDAIREQVLLAMDTIPTVKPGDCEVYVHAGVVTLSGRVKSRQALFDIEHLICKTPGIRGLQTYIQADVASDKIPRGAVKDRRISETDRRH